MIILTWEALGFRLAYAKGQIGHTVTWIGGTIACEALGVRVRVKQTIIDEIKADLAKYLAGNIISLKDLHSTVGRINYAAGLLVVLRPFMEPLWAVLNDHRTTNAPTNCVWTSQLRPTLLWFRAFFENEGAQLERFFSLEAYSRRGDVFQIGTDASPYGMGGWITVNGRVKRYFGCPISDHDVKTYGQQRGSCDGQQLWECLAVLVALDLWAPLWKQKHVTLQIKGDNVTALTLLLKFRPSTPEMAIIAKELALRLAVLSFPPDAIHVPGVSHIAADALSRVFAPGASNIVDESTHHSLAGAVKDEPPARSDDWYRALTLDAATAVAEEVCGANN